MIESGRVSERIRGLMYVFFLFIIVVFISKIFISILGFFTILLVIIRFSIIR